VFALFSRGIEHTFCEYLFFHKHNRQLVQIYAFSKIIFESLWVILRTEINSYTETAATACSLALTVSTTATEYLWRAQKEQLCMVSVICVVVGLSFVNSHPIEHVKHCRLWILPNPSPATILSPLQSQTALGYLSIRSELLPPVHARTSWREGEESRDLAGMGLVLDIWNRGGAVHWAKIMHGSELCLVEIV
jgi:hypothetical protein